jgi:hypothetical protein
MMLVVFPVGMNLFVFAMAAIRVRAPQFLWPFLAAAAVAAVIFSGAGVVRPYPKQAKAGGDGFRDAIEMVRASPYRMLGLILLMTLGLIVFVEVAHLFAPYARLWLRG